MKDTPQRIPKLRFPGFSGEWESKKLHDYLSFKNGINASKEDYGKGYKFINVLDIINNEYIIHDKIIGQVDISEDIFKKNIVEYGDILFQRSSETREEVGQSNVYLDKEKKATFGGFVIRGKKIENYNPSFMNYLLKTSNSRKEITSKSGGSTRYNVGQETLKEVKIYTTLIPEQQKIAAFLTAIDQKLTQLERKKTLLEQYKKGIMQQLFSQKIRFKDDNGQSYPDWDEKRLGEIGDFKTSSIDKKIVEGEKLVNLINYMDVYNRKELSNSNTDRLMRVSAKDNQIEGNNLKKGDILFTPSSETPKDIGHSVVIFEDLENTVYSYHLLRYRPKINIDILFSHYFCNITSVFKQLSRFATGSTRFTISVDNFSKVEVKLPCLAEQTKIAAFLSSIDNKIALVNNQLENTRQFKKGLLQQLFV